jgi:hypothetical protein
MKRLLLQYFLTKIEYQLTVTELPKLIELSIAFTERLINLYKNAIKAQNEQIALSRARFEEKIEIAESETNTSIEQYSTLVSRLAKVVSTITPTQK